MSFGNFTLGGKRERWQALLMKKLLVSIPCSTKALKCLEKASSMALTVATLTDCRLECANKYQLVFTSVEEVFAKPFLSSIMKSK